jgi:hypothetical protein
MSAGGILTDTMANLKYTVVNPEAVMKSPKVQARIAAAKKAAADKQKVSESPMKFLSNLVLRYIKSPEKYVLKAWSDDNNGRSTPLLTGKGYIVYLNKGHPEGAKAGAFHNSAYGEGLHYAVQEEQTRLIYPRKTGDWITDLTDAAEEADVLVKKPNKKKNQEAIKSIGHFAWRRSGSDDTKKRYIVKSGETQILLELNNYPTYLEEFKPMKGYKIFYKDFKGEGSVSVLIDKKTNKEYLYVMTPTSSKEEADKWLETFGSNLVFHPEKTLRENIRYS